MSNFYVWQLMSALVCHTNCKRSGLYLAHCTKLNFTTSGSGIGIGRIQKHIAHPLPPRGRALVEKRVSNPDSRWCLQDAASQGVIVHKIFKVFNNSPGQQAPSQADRVC